MQLAVVLGLGVLWAIVLLPDVLRRTTSRRSHDSISSFNHHLSVLEKSNPAMPTHSNVFPLVPRGQGQPSQPSSPIGYAPAASLPSPQTPQPVPPLAPQRARGAAPVAARQGRPAATGAMTSAQAQRRRQDVITGLAALALLSLLATLTFGPPMLYVHLFIDTVFVVYLALALGMTRRQKVQSKVHYLAPQAQPVRAEYPGVARTSVGR